MNKEDHSVEDMKVTGLAFCYGLISRNLLEEKIIARIGCVLRRGLNIEFNFPGLLFE